MEFTDTSIPGVKIINTRTFEDNRGSFFELFRQDLLRSEINSEFKLAQVNCSVSAKGVVRGMHFAGFPPGQAKYVTCISGRIQDVFVDLRLNSPTFGKWETCELSESNHKAVYIPSGIGHGFMALEDGSVAVYLCDQKYNPDNEFEFNAFDPEVGIEWHGDLTPVLSEKDLNAPGFDAIKELLESFSS